MRTAIVAALLLGLAAPAVGFEAGGMSIDLPAGFIGDVQSHPDFAVAIGVSPPSSGSIRPTGYLGLTQICGGGLAGQPIPGQTQEQLNVVAVSPQATDGMKSAYLPGTFSDEGSLTIDGIAWYEFSVSVESQPEIKVFVSYSVTPAGVVAFSCAAFNDEFDGALPVFRQLRDTLKGPPA